MILPKGWTYENTLDIAENEFVPMGIWKHNQDGITKLFSTLWFYDEEGNCVAAIGYDVFPDPNENGLDESETPDPEFIYCMIAIGNCRYDIACHYDIVSNPWNNETATTVSFYSHQYVPDELKGYMTTEYMWSNPAFVSCDRNAEVYIAMEFDQRYVNNDLVMEIAKSLQLISKGAEC